MLTNEQRMKLKNASRIKRNYKQGDVDFNQENLALEIAIAECKSENPQAFLTPDTLILRKFFHKPQFPIPHQSYEVSK
jgi:hypothetical protein